MRRSYFRCLLAFSVLFGVACGQANREPLQLNARAEVLLGENPEVVASGLTPGAEYRIVAESRDVLQRLWRSEATFSADAGGTIDATLHAPISGDYRGPDPYGLLWSMRMPTPPGEDWEPPEARDYSEFSFSLVQGDSVLATAGTRQWTVPPGSASVPLEAGLVGELFVPGGGEPAPALLLLGGSGGGYGWARRIGSLLSTRGYVTLALAYFNEGDLPDALIEIPLEYVEGAIEYLSNRAEVDAGRLGIVGYSKGAELALLVASRRPEVRAVAAYAPGSAVFQGFRAPDYPVLSSWSAAGEPLPFVPNAYDDRFFETFDGMYLWYRTLEQYDAMLEASIPVEQVNGPVLLLSGADDEIWPATLMAEQIVARLGVNEFPHDVRHLALPDAGHGIAAPPGEPLAGVAERLGGTPAGNARARAVGWTALLEFLDEALGLDGR